MLQKSIELQRTFENQTQLTKNFNRLCIDWLNYILKRYNEANIKEAPHYIKPFLDYCKAKEPKQTEVENNESKNEAPKDGTITETKIKDYKDAIWFKTGIKLATGEAFELYEKYKNDKGHFSKICLELGFKKTDRPYFSATIQDNISDKNTFANKDKLQKLHKELTEKNLLFGTFFLEKYNQIEAK